MYYSLHYFRGGGYASPSKNNHLNKSNIAPKSNQSNQSAEQKLFNAAASGNLDEVKKLVAQGAIVNLAGDDGQTPLMVAVNGGHLEVAKFLVESGAWINAQDHSGDNMLHRASREGNLTAVKILLELGADIDFINKHQQTALLITCFKGNDSISQVLIDAGADVNFEAPTKEGTVAIQVTPLIAAVMNDHVSIVHQLISSEKIKGFSQVENALYVASSRGNEEIVDLLIRSFLYLDVNETTTWHGIVAGETPLHSACSHGHIGVVKRLIDAGANVNASAKTFLFDGGTPLMLAIIQKHEAIIKMLIDAGADVNAIMKISQQMKSQSNEENQQTSFSPLILAIEAGVDSIIKLLISSGADVNLKIDGETPLITACRKGRDFAVQALISAGAKVNVIGSKGFSPLIIASMFGHFNIASLLISAGADVDFEGVLKDFHSESSQEQIFTPLHAASMGGHESIAKLLISAGAKPNSSKHDNKGETPLHMAIREGHENIVRILISAGADVNFMTEKIGSPLAYAASRKNDIIIKMLIDAKADINGALPSGEMQGVTPLVAACLVGNVSGAKLLLAEGANANVSVKTSKDSENRWTLLHFSSQSGHDKIVKLLISAGADVNAVDSLGQTPLHLAVQQEHVKVIKALIAGKANINALTKFHSTPLEHAISQDNVPIVKLLVSSGANVNIGGAEIQGFKLSPILQARHKGNQEIINILRRAGARE